MNPHHDERGRFAEGGGGGGGKSGPDPSSGRNYVGGKLIKAKGNVSYAEHKAYVKAHVPGGKPVSLAQHKKVQEDHNKYDKDPVGYMKKHGSEDQHVRTINAVVHGQHDVAVLKSGSESSKRALEGFRTGEPVVINKPESASRQVGKVVWKTMEDSGPLSRGREKYAVAFGQNPTLRAAQSGRSDYGYYSRDEISLHLPHGHKL